MADIHIAYHEVGHFVTSCHLLPHLRRFGLSILSPESGIDGYAGLEAPETLDDVTVVENIIVALYAGAAAELRLDPSRELKVRSGARGDEAHATWFRENSVQEVAPEPELRRRADEFVIEHWDEIEAVATELLKRKRLSSEEADRAIQGARRE